jgi:Flp pilus assembly protein TadB
MRWKEIRARNAAIQHKLHVAVMAETSKVAEADEDTNDRELSRIMAAPAPPNTVRPTGSPILGVLRCALKIVSGLGFGIGAVIGLIYLGKGLTAVELLAIAVVFTIGVFTGIVLLVSVASRREDRREKLSREHPDAWSLAGRFLTGLYIRRPGDDSARRSYPDKAHAGFGWSDYESEDERL